MLDLLQWTALTPNVAIMLMGIGGLLAAAGLVIRLRSKQIEAHDRRELRDRLRTWWVILIALTVSLASGKTASLIFFAFISFLALKEYVSIIPTRRADRRTLLLAYLAIPIQYYWIADGWYDVFTIFIPVYMLLLLSARLVTIGQTDGFLKSVGTLHFGMMVTIYALSHAAYFLVLPPSINPLGEGPGFILYLVFLTSLNDVAQFVWGKTFGKRQLSPQVSPNKTWEGLVGGTITTVGAAALLAPFLTPHSLPVALGAGVLIAIGGVFGDLTVSAIKRDLNVKDTGSTLPGHGGILDRLDSLLFTAPLYFHYVSYLYT